MSSTARHISPATIRATHRLNGRAARRRAVLRFLAVWRARLDRAEVGIVIAASIVGAAGFLTVGYAARLFQMGVL